MISVPRSAPGAFFVLTPPPEPALCPLEQRRRSPPSPASCWGSGWGLWRWSGRCARREGGPGSTGAWPGGGPCRSLAERLGRFCVRLRPDARGSGSSRAAARCPGDACSSPSDFASQRKTTRALYRPGFAVTSLPRPFPAVYLGRLTCPRRAAAPARHLQRFLIWLKLLLFFALCLSKKEKRGLGCGISGCRSVARGCFPQRSPAVSRAKYRLPLSLVGRGAEPAGAAVPQRLGTVRDRPSTGRSEGLGAWPRERWIMPLLAARSCSGGTVRAVGTRAGMGRAASAPRGASACGRGGEGRSAMSRTWPEGQWELHGGGREGV